MHALPWCRAERLKDAAFQLNRGAAFGPAGAERPGVFDVVMYKTSSSDESSDFGSSIMVETAWAVLRQDAKVTSFAPYSCVLTL